MPEIIHGRSASYDPYNDVRKPRSRAAVGEPNTLMPIPTAVPTSSNQGNFNNNYDDFQLKYVFILLKSVFFFRDLTNAPLTLTKYTNLNNFGWVEKKWQFESGPDSRNAGTCSSAKTQSWRANHVRFQNYKRK